jgi:hypothetical protein
MPFITNTKQKNFAKGLIPSTIVFADKHVIVAHTEDQLQRSAYILTNKKRTLWLQSASEVYRSSNRRLSKSVTVAWSAQRNPTAINLHFL